MYCKALEYTKAVSFEFVCSENRFVLGFTKDMKEICECVWYKTLIAPFL